MMDKLMQRAIDFLNSEEGQKMVKPIFEASRREGIEDSETRARILEGVYLKLLHDNKELMKEESDRIAKIVYTELNK